jgi:hypothetical protein
MNLKLPHGMFNHQWESLTILTLGTYYLTSLINVYIMSSI